MLLIQEWCHGVIKQYIHGLYWFGLRQFTPVEVQRWQISGKCYWKQSHSILIARDDVFHPRQITLECNEHTFGMWRTMSSSHEFNMDQLIRIVQKTHIKTDAIFNS